MMRKQHVKDALWEWLETHGMPCGHAISQQVTSEYGKITCYHTMSEEHVYPPDNLHMFGCGAGCKQVVCGTIVAPLNQRLVGELMKQDGLC